MPEIPSVGIKGVSIPEIPAWRAIPPQSIPEAPPITLQLGFPVANIPGCVQTRNAQPGNADAYSDDPRGNVVLCDGTVPSYKPLDFTPGTLTYQRAKPPAPDPEPKKSAGSSKTQPTDALAPMPADKADISNLVTELPCPPPDAIPLGAKNKAQTAIVIGYERVNGKCEAIYEPLGIPTIIGNYLPGAPVVATTATIAAVATTSAIVAKPLGNFLLKAVKPIVKKTIKKIKEKLGKKIAPESAAERRAFQRSLRK